VQCCAEQRGGAGRTAAPCQAEAAGQRKKKGGGKRKKGKKEKGKENKKRKKKREKGLEKLGEILRKLGEGKRRWRFLVIGGDGKAGRPAGSWLARDSR
jgi:hypothetical protein